MGWPAVNRVAKIMKDGKQTYGNVLTWSQDPSKPNYEGVYSGEREKELYAKELQELLLRDGLAIYDKFITNEQHSTPEEMLMKHAWICFFLLAGCAGTQKTGASGDSAEKKPATKKPAAHSEAKRDKPKAEKKTN